MIARMCGFVLLSIAITIAAQTREQAVAMARAGHLEEGISALRSLIAAGDTSKATAYDLAVTLTWAKRPQEATDVFERTGTADAPEYVMLAMTRAYWDQRRYDEGEGLARRGLASFAANSDWTKLLGMIGGEAADRSGDLYTALRDYGEARERLPTDEDLRKATAGVLARLGAPYAASSILGQPDAGLEAQKAGLMVRWGAQLRPPQPELRFAGTDAAIARLDALIAETLAAEPLDAGLLARLRRDRVVALRDRERWADAVKQAEELRSSGDRIPPYVQQAEADALLALRRPGEARVAYNNVIEAEPQNTSAKHGRFFTEVEEEDFRAAFATVDAITEQEAPVTQPGGDAAYWANPEWVGSQVTAALARNYASMDAEAWRRLDPLGDQAPALGYLRAARGGVAASRGWRRRAAEDVEIAAALSPLDLGGQVALAESYFRLGQYAEARKRAHDLALLYPENAAVQRLAREVGELDRYEFVTRSQSYHESGGIANPLAPGNGYTTINRIYSPLLGNHWRIVGGFDYEDARVPEGLAQRFREGGGIEWRRPFLTVEADGLANTGTLQRGGAILNAAWAPTDHWNFSMTAELFSMGTPLRAVKQGITANEVRFSAGYDWHESTGWAANVGWLPFSDGNRRLTGGFRFAQKLVNRPHLNVTARPDLYVESNSKPDAPYFNPTRAFSFYAGADVDHIMWRRYERSFRQHVSFGAGGYWQQQYGTAAIAGAAYEQVFEFGSTMNLRYGASYARRVYDGGPVDSLTLSVAMTWRF
jgi:biofilm PGA synthesis protein PgaA